MWKYWFHWPRTSPLMLPLMPFMLLLIVKFLFRLMPVSSSQDKPHFISVNEILRICNDQTVELLKRELEIRKAELMEKLLFSSLEKIFIENRIYRDIEEAKHGKR